MWRDCSLGRENDVIKLLDLHDRRVWKSQPGDLQSASARATKGACRLIEQAHARGLTVLLWGNRWTEIIGVITTNLHITYVSPAPGASRVTRYRITERDGRTVSQVNAAQAAEWVANQPRQQS